MQRDAGTSGKRLDAHCRPDGAALRVAPRRPPAASRASTVFPDTLFGPLLADRTPGRVAGRDHGEKCGLADVLFDRVRRSDERSSAARPSCASRTLTARKRKMSPGRAWPGFHNEPVGTV